MLMIGCGFTYREVARLINRVLGVKIHISNIYYRLKEMEGLEGVVNKVIRSINVEKVKGRCRGLLVDGAGFGYNFKIKQRLYFGREIREKRDHVKCELLVLVDERGKSYIVGVFVDDGYKDERKILKSKFEEVKKLKEEVDFRKVYGDRLYNRDIELLREFEKEGVEMILPVEDGIHNKVKSEERKRVKESYNRKRHAYNRNRYKIEQKIGNIKRFMGTYLNTKDKEVSKNLVLLGV